MGNCNPLRYLFVTLPELFMAVGMQPEDVALVFAAVCILKRNLSLSVVGG